jgi:hypothetical protein
VNPINPTNLAAKWAQNLSGASQSYIQGVQAVTESPTAKAAANPQKYLAGVAGAVNSGKWANKLNAVTLNQWQQAATQVGAQRLASGATAAKPKVAAFWQQFGPILQQVTTQTNQMPSNTVQDRINKAVAQMTNLHNAAVQAGMGKAS